MLATLTSPAAREWLYGIALAALAVATFYKIVSADALPLWLALIAGILGIGATGTAAVKVHQQRNDGTLSSGRHAKPE
jgi:hypothetical protein